MTKQLTGSRRPRVAVVGAGLSGLGAAAILARRGCAVDLFEALPDVGGVARSLSKHGLVYSPGPQYAWGWQEGGPAWRALDEIDLDLSFIEIPDDYEQLAIKRGAFETVTESIPSSVYALPAAERRRALAFARALDAAGRAGEHIGEGARFRLSEFAMSRALVTAPVPFQDKITAIQMRGRSVSKLAEQYGISPSTLRLMTHHQAIFAEKLETLSALLFACARHHLNHSVWFPRGGFGALVSALESACESASVKIHTNTEVRTASLSREGLTTLTFGDRSSATFSHVVWACSPGMLGKLLEDEAANNPTLRRLKLGLSERFQPSHPISALDLFVELEPEDIESVRAKNFSWFAHHEDIDFSDATERPPETINFTLPTTFEAPDSRAHVICAFSHAGCPPELLERGVLDLLERVGVRPRVFDRIDLNPRAWSSRFGAFGGSVYGRRMTYSSLTTPLGDDLPTGWQLAHSGAGIPGILGCLQTSLAVANKISAHAITSSEAAP